MSDAFNVISSVGIKIMAWWPLEQNALKTFAIIFFMGKEVCVQKTVERNFWKCYFFPG
jgi:hypothetical protein